MNDDQSRYQYITNSPISFFLKQPDITPHPSQHPLPLLPPPHQAPLSPPPKSINSHPSLLPRHLPSLHHHIRIHPCTKRCGFVLFGLLLRGFEYGWCLWCRCSSWELWCGLLVRWGGVRWSLGREGDVAEIKVIWKKGAEPQHEGMRWHLSSNDNDTWRLKVSNNVY